MSWSVGATGKAPEVKEKIAQQFANASKCAEPEESIRAKAADLIHLALEHQDPEKDVNVTAYGSQNVYGGTLAVVRNSLNITITPQG